MTRYIPKVCPYQRRNGKWIPKAIIEIDSRKDVKIVKIDRVDIECNTKEEAYEVSSKLVRRWMTKQGILPEGGRGGDKATG